jgi:hypothetical protein
MKLSIPAGLVAAGITLTLGTGVAFAATGDRQLSRLAGDSRYTTAVQISQEAFPRGAHSVFLARADAFADALAAASLTDRGPILLVPQCGTVPQEVIAEANRLQPVEVVALGGSGAVCDQVLQQFQGSTSDAAPGEDVVTVNGPGDQNSEPFVLKGGDYAVSYNFSGDCFYGAFLSRTVDGNPVEDIASGSGPLQGETNLFALAPQEYFVDMTANNSDGCPWTITFTSR